MPRVEAYAERLRDMVLARAWDRCVADRMGRLPELLLDHVIEGLRAGPEGKEAMIRQAASIGQWLLEKCLPALTGTTTASVRAPGTAARAVATSAQVREPGETDRQLAAKIELVRCRLAEVTAAPDPAEARAAGSCELPDSPDSSD